MGDHNSSLTRVQPVFNELLDKDLEGDSWLEALWDMAALTRQGATMPKPVPGRLLPSEVPADRPGRVGKVFERTVAPPAAFLRWLLAHPKAMQVRDPVNFGAKNPEAQQWRRRLFSGDPRLAAEARDEGLNQLSKRLGPRGRNKWWAFEGFSRVDCCLIADHCVLFVEGKRTEGVSPSTLWYQQRSQLWRNVEAAREFAGEKAFALILAAESEADGTTALADAASSLAGSFPHLDDDERNELSRHLLGFVTWSSIVSRFSLRPELLVDREP